MPGYRSERAVSSCCLTHCLSHLQKAAIKCGGLGLPYRVSEAFDYLIATSVLVGLRSRTNYHLGQQYKP